jgi:hypothetical protein
MNSPFVLQPCSSRCGLCGSQDISMLIRRVPATRDPVFYICWTCKNVFHAGKSVVEKVGGG